MTRDELVEDLARVIAESLGWEWNRDHREYIPSALDVTRDSARDVVDRLEALGWRPPATIVVNIDPPPSILRPYTVSTCRSCGRRP